MVMATEAAVATEMEVMEVTLVTVRVDTTKLCKPLGMYFK